MTIEQMDAVIQKHCWNTECEGCQIKNPCDRCDGLFQQHPKECEEAYNILTDEEDVINHPNHYNRDGAMESIDEMVLVFGKEAVKNFCLCNTWKYRYRAADKNGTEDMKKSDWYMRKYKELCSNE